MPDKQKVTLYLSDELHRQFKIRSAVDGETMSSMAQRALEFYLTHADLVQGGVESHGTSYQIHSCPQCEAAVTLKDNSLTLIHTHADCTMTDLTGLERIPKLRDKAMAHDVRCEDHSDKDSLSSKNPQEDAKSPDEGELITC